MAFLQVPQEYANKTTEQIVAEAGSGGMPHLPDGKYTGVFLASELKNNSAGTGQYLEMKLVITQGQYKDTEFTERLNIKNPNAVAVKIAYETMAKIAKAVGLAQIPSDSSALHNKPLTVVLKTEEGQPFKDRVTGEQRMGKPKSVIAGYEALPQGAMGSMGSPSASVHPTDAPMPWAK